MKPPKKKKKRTMALTVNFFTTYNMIECSQRLISQPIIGTNYQTQTHIEHEGRFQIKLLPLNPMTEYSEQPALQPIVGRNDQTQTNFDARFINAIFALIEFLFSGGWVVLEFHGYLEPAANGTHVRGGLSQLTRRTTQSYHLFTLVAIITAIVIMAIALNSQLWWGGAAFLGLLLATALMAMIMHARGLQRTVRLMAPWVQQQLASEG